MRNWKEELEFSDYQDSQPIYPDDEAWDEINDYDDNWDYDEFDDYEDDLYDEYGEYDYDDVIEWWEE